VEVFCAKVLGSTKIDSLELRALARRAHMQWSQLRQGL
jgi:hypothetical protein